ncbi:hypothetical protein TCK1_1106 [Pseudomonas monteilii]|uniref:Uncharacterized protein n=1 Tax=Pseudomonas monteilii TaxID=76759 RepID=A0AAE6V1M3_9PSED|nr:hypothetical protein [Pseudomonas monteilii]QHB26452.1 hypothetical protein TCK1_1106 [Pseudomonas monteilii]
MPTENRSSNTEMVSVPRRLLETIRSFHWTQQDSTDLARAKARAELIDVLAQPAPQPHPEPIAWMVGTAFWWTKEEAERDAAATGLQIVGLGPMTDTGEIARLREELGYMREERDDLSYKLDRFYSRTHGIKNLAAIEQLSDKQAERDALLQRMKTLFRADDPFDLYDAVCSALSEKT